MKSDIFEKQFKAAVDNYWKSVNETWGRTVGEKADWSFVERQEPLENRSRV